MKDEAIVVGINAATALVIQALQLAFELARMAKINSDELDDIYAKEAARFSINTPDKLPPVKEV